MKKRFLTLVAFTVASPSAPAQDYTQYVDLFIETGGYGCVFLGASIPPGNAQAGPTREKQGWDWCSGYHYSGSTVIELGQTHSSSTGISDSGGVSLLPTTNPARCEAKFAHRAGHVTPGYYSVTLVSGVRIELTATQCAASHRHASPADATKGYVILSLSWGTG